MSPKYQRSITKPPEAGMTIGPALPTRANAEPIKCPREDLNLHAR